MALPRRRYMRVTGAEREKLRAQLAAEYRGGKSIRRLAHDHNLSVGLTRIILVEADTPLRPRASANLSLGSKK